MITVKFDLQAFADFEGTQEELDELVKEVQNYFSSLTLEQLELLTDTDSNSNEWQNFSINLDAGPNTLH